MATQLHPHVVVFGPGANCTFEICSIQSSVYGYRPSLAANICLAALFAIASGVHAYLGVRSRSWFFMGCMLLGCVSAIGGYIGRILLYYNPWSFAAFMIQILGVGITPVYLCAAIYITLCDTVTFLAPSLSRFPPKFYYRAFLFFDAISLSIQATGVGMAAAGSGISDVGVKLAIIGLSFQLLTILIFCGLFCDFLIRFFRSNRLAVKSVTQLKIFFTFLSLALLFITIRSAYRLYELHGGFCGDSLKNERVFIGMEGVLVIVSVYCLILSQPGLAFNV